MPRRRPAAAAVATIMMALLGAPAAAPAKARPDRAFGSHRDGHWERGGPAWGTVARVLPGRDGTALVLGEDGRVARIGTDGRPDARWGGRGTLHLDDNGYWGAGAVPAARWNGGYAFVTPDGLPLVVDRRGRRRPVTDALAGVILRAGGASAIDRLLPDPDGSLWHLRTATGAGGGLLQRLGRDGRPRGVPATLPATGPLHDDELLHPVLTRAGIVAALCDGGRERCAVRRLRADGTLDPRFRTIALGAVVTAVLPWRAGGVVVVGETRVLWADARGRVVRRRALPGGQADAVALDPAGRLLVAGRTRDEQVVTVRRLRADGRRDRAFGTARLPVPGDGAVPLAVLAAPHGRVLVVGQALEQQEVGIREDFDLVTYRTVVWRLRTR